MARVTIDGSVREVAEGATVLQALRAVGLDVPTLCHDDRLEPYGGCRLCIVEIEGRPRPVTACNTQVADGMKIATHSAAVEAERRTLLRLLARDFPRDAGEGPFQDLLRRYGVEPLGASGPPASDDAHPYINLDLSRCIDCYRCVRICDEVQGQSVWKAWGRGDRTRIAPASGGTLLESGCVSCGACADTCPTGAIADRHGGATGWTKTLCPYCGVGC